MAWLKKGSRAPRGESRKRTYWTICWRDDRAKERARSLGFVSAAEAKRALKVFEGKLAAGELVDLQTSAASSSKERSRPTVEMYLSEVYVPIMRRDRAKATADSAMYASRALCRHLGEVHLDQIGFAIVEGYITARKAEGRRTRTIQIELRTLRSALKHATDCELLDRIPKLPSIRDTDRKPHKFLTPDECRRLLENLKPLEEQPHKVTRGAPPIRRDRLTYVAVLMALNTGARKSEILTRGWEDVRWDQGRYGVLLVGAKPEIGFQVKTRRDRAIPLSPELHEVLTELHHGEGKPSSGWIFPSPKDQSRPRQDFGHALRRACRDAGIQELHPHGLRHTWASRLAVAGVDRRTLMELGGWKEGRMLDEIYAHATDEHKVDVMARMGIA